MDMAERRTARTARRGQDDKLAEEPDDELAEEPDDELAEEPDDELAEEPDDELAEEPDDELAEEEPEQASGDDGRGTERRSRPDRRGGVKPAKAGQIAMRQITELTGKEPEGITGVEPAEDGWMVGVEVVEDRRVPSSTDILATYEVELDSAGELVSYRRAKRYTRGHGDDGDA
jgi:hypothetical protein